MPNGFLKQFITSLKTIKMVYIIIIIIIRTWSFCHKTFPYEFHIGIIFFCLLHAFQFVSAFETRYVFGKQTCQLNLSN